MTCKNHRPPGFPAYACATPSTAMILDLLGRGARFEGVTVSESQMRALRKMYLYTDEAANAIVEEQRAAHLAAEAAKIEHNAKLEEGYARKHNTRHPEKFDAEGVRRFVDSGDARDVFRRASRDGLRMLAFLAKYIEPGGDPVKLLVQLASDAGFDVDGSDVEWANAEDSAEDESPEPSEAEEMLTR